MRSLSTELLNAQKARTIDVLYKIVLTKGTVTYTYDQNRIISGAHDEDIYTQKATIILDNSDNELTSKDLKGYKCVIHYGMVTSAGNQYSAAAPLFVTGQQFNSHPGKLTCELTMVGIPNLMDEDHANQSYVPTSDDILSAKMLIVNIIGAYMPSFNHCQYYQMIFDEGYDTLIDTYLPKDSFAVYTGGSRLAALRRVLDFSANVARFEGDGRVHILKPTISGSTYDYEYNLQDGHTFFSKAYKNTLVIPNKIVVKTPPKTEPFYLGYAQTSNYDSLAEDVKKTKFILLALDSSEQAQQIAQALITKSEMWTARGSAEVPLNVGAEVFDYVKVTDQRQNDVRIGNLGYVHRRFGSGKWTMTFGFGNWLDVLQYNQVLKDIELYTDAGTYIERLQVKDLYVQNIQADNCDFVWLDPDNTIDLSKIGDDLDNLPDGEQYARIKSMHLDAGQLVLGEEVIYKPGYDPTDKFDLNDNDLDDIPEGVTYHRVKTSALTADGLVIMDNIVAGTYGKIRSTALTAGGLVLMDKIENGTYGKVLATQIYSGMIRLSATYQDSTARSVSDTEKNYWNNKPSTMDEIQMGINFGKPRIGQVDTSGYIHLNANTLKDGTWYNTGGIKIDASYGIVVYGRDRAFVTRATETGTDQCYVGSDGKLYAAGGSVYLDSYGLNLKGYNRFILFRNPSDVMEAAIYMSASQTLYLYAPTKIETQTQVFKFSTKIYTCDIYPQRYTSDSFVDLWAADYCDVLVTATQNYGLRPRFDNHTTLGYSNYRWSHLYAVNVHQGDSIFANDWRFTETPDNKGIMLLRPDNSIAQVWE
jgi:hypothetical protein